MVANQIDPGPGHQDGESGNEIQWFEEEVRGAVGVGVFKGVAQFTFRLAFTLSNGLTIVEYYLARGMHIDEFAPNLSFFFSNGMDPEYTVIGRVARRIWVRAMRERYGANHILLASDDVIFRKYTGALNGGAAKNDRRRAVRSRYQCEWGA